MHIRGSGRLKLFVSIILSLNKKKDFIKFIHSDNFARKVKNLHSNSVNNFELVTYANSSSFPDLILSIVSFIKFVGIPKKWTIYTDDKFSEVQMHVFSSFIFLNVLSWNHVLSENISNQYSHKWQLRKFASYAAHEKKGTTIYLDSDIIFYPNFKKYVNDFNNYNWYLPEPAESYNIDLNLENNFNFKKLMYTVNAGFFILNGTPDWILGFKYLDSSIVNSSNDYFLDQSALNLMFCEDENAKVLDPRIFHVSADDHFWVSSLNPGEFAIRHYVGLIRHKMWQLGWKHIFKS